ncbi:MAG: hypothetical protein M1839_007598 [Geoglossum umbratile]|nr:MAG: hypothetical protein M1839_007598 [Geoglossum umbratile]
MGANNHNEEWSDEQLETALRRLDEMHRQLRTLRTTIPRMIKPLTTPHDTRNVPHPAPCTPKDSALTAWVYCYTAEELYRDFARAAATAGEEVKAFRRFRNENGSREVFERAGKSRSAEGAGIVVWRATEYPEAFDRPVVVEGEGGKKGGVDGGA